MSLFPRTHFLSQSSAEQPHQTQSSYHPLFRLFDEFDQYSRTPERAARQSTTPNTSNQHNHAQVSSHFGNLFKSTPTFTPKFDVKETKDGYELHGEFPGIDQKDIEIEFTDSNTLTIKGRTERSYTSGTPSASTNNNNKGAIEAAPEKGDTHSTTNGENRPSTSSSDHQPKVEDEDAALSSEVQNTIAKFRSEKQVTKHNNDKPTNNNKPASEEKYWISERSVGEFERSFSFPVRVDRDAVKASMKNGVLSVLVPKAKKVEARRIVIEDASN